MKVRPEQGCAPADKGLALSPAPAQEGGRTRIFQLCEGFFPELSKPVRYDRFCHSNTGVVSAIGQALCSAVFHVFHNLSHKSTTSTQRAYALHLRIIESWCRFDSTPIQLMKAEAALDVCPICEGTGWKTLEAAQA